MTFEQDVVDEGNRKMGRYGGGNGIWMEDPHPGTGVEFDMTAVNAAGGRYHNNAMYKYGTYEGGAGRPGIFYRTINPGGAHAHGGRMEMPRKTGQGLPWDL